MQVISKNQSWKKSFQAPIPTSSFPKIIPPKTEAPFSSAFLFVAVIVASLFCVPQSLQAKDLLTLESLSRLRDGVKEHVLPNGLKILFYERDVAPVFSGVVSVRVGGVDEATGKTGASHLFEHLAFKGTPNIGTRDYAVEKVLLKKLESLRGKADLHGELSEEERAEIDEVLSELSKVWNIAEFTQIYRKWGQEGMNATTGKEVTNYFASFPVSSFEFWCWIESERLTRSVPRQFYKERDVVLEERRARYENSPGGKLYEKLLGQAFLQHPYRHPVIGYEKDIRKLQPSDVMALYKKYYVASNIVVGIVGDLKFEEALPTIEKYFGRLPRGERPEQPSVVEPEQAGERRFSVQHDAEPLVFAGYRKPVYPDPKEPAISLFLEYAMGSRVAPLYKEIVLEKKLASSFGYFEAPSDTFPNLVIFYAEPIAPQTNESVLAAFDKSLKELLAKPVPAKQMEIIKRRMMKGALMSMKSNMGLASELAEVEQKFGSWKVTIDWYRQMLELTPEQVRAAAMEILSSERRTVGLLSRGTNGAE